MENTPPIKSKKWEALIWSIALPGFGQLLNRKYIKGIVFISLEFVINVIGNVNRIIIYSFHGDMGRAVEAANFQWFMFYPCLYFFAIWDAYKDAGGGKSAYAYLPLASTTFLTTIAVIYSSTFKINDYLIGPVWLPIVTTPLGLLIGWLIQKLLQKV